MGQAWPYAQSPAPSVAPSVMSHYQNDDRMSMLSVNTTMTNQYPEVQRCFSSNGSTCENVNPELSQVNLVLDAQQAIKEFHHQRDPNRRFQLAMTIREWVRRDKFMNVDPAKLSDVIDRILRIIHDGMIIQPLQLPHSYYFQTQLYCYLLDILVRITSYQNTLPFMHLVVDLFNRIEHTPKDFRALLANVLQLNNQNEDHFKPCVPQAFQVFENIIQYLNNPKHEALRLQFLQAVKFRDVFDALVNYFHPSLHTDVLNPTVLMIVRFIVSKDANLKNSLIWGNYPKRDELPPGSMIHALRTVVLRFHQVLMNIAARVEQEKQAMIARRYIQVVTRTFELLSMLMHDSPSIEGYVKSGGIDAICTVVSYPNIDIARTGFRLLLHVSDAKSVLLINLKDILPFIIGRIRQSLQSNDLKKYEDDDIVYCGTGFLSNAVANKQGVKDLAIQNHAIELLYDVVFKYTPLNELRETLRRKLACEIISNSLRTLNNFLLMWVKTQNGQAAQAPDHVKMQVQKFFEVDIQKRLMVCLSIEGIDTAAMLELRSTILRSFSLLLRTGFVPTHNLMRVTDDTRKNNIVQHICAAFSWAMGQTVNERNRDAISTLVERIFNFLAKLIDECHAAEEVAISFYGVSCPLSLISDSQAKPLFILNVLFVCDKVLKYNPSVANVWSVDRPMLEVLKNHSNPEIERAASAVLSQLPDTDPLAVILSNS